MRKTAVLVDGGFFLKRYRFLCKGDTCTNDPKCVADAIFDMSKEHIKWSSKADGGRHCLYRIFYYDCEPFNSIAHNPITGKAVNFKKSSEYAFRTQLFEELRQKRKVALRLGRLAGKKTWKFRNDKKFQALIRGQINPADLNENDVIYTAQQKQVDIKLGLDIATLAYKKLVDQIVIIAGDSDFVPVTKVARREGIDIILDPMNISISSDLKEHIDGLRSVWSKITGNPEVQDTVDESIGQNKALLDHLKDK